MRQAVKGTDFSMKGTGFRPYIEGCTSTRALAPEKMQKIVKRTVNAANI
jgi:hypothetical protein